jgi:hypothetical protein
MIYFDLFIYFLMIIIILMDLSCLFIFAKYIYCLFENCSLFVVIIINYSINFIYYFIFKYFLDLFLIISNYLLFIINFNIVKAAFKHFTVKEFFIYDIIIFYFENFIHFLL